MPVPAPGMRHRVSALWGVKPGGNPESHVSHPLATGEGKSGRANNVNLCIKPRKAEPWRWKDFLGFRAGRWDAAVLAGVGTPAR